MTIAYAEGISLIQSVVLADPGSVRELARGEMAKVVICRAQTAHDEPRLDCHSPCVPFEARFTMRRILKAMAGASELVAESPEDKLTFTALALRASSATERALYAQMASDPDACARHASRVASALANAA